MLFLPLNPLSLLLNNWKLIVGALIVGSLVLYGYRWGAGRVQADWDESARLQRELTQAAIDRAQASANKHSALYQAEIAKQKQTVTQMERILHYEINRSYSQCIATDELVRVWRQAFDPALPGPAEPGPGAGGPAVAAAAGR